MMFLVVQLEHSVLQPREPEDSLEPREPEDSLDQGTQETTQEACEEI